MFASDFKQIARNSLAGRWGMAVLAGLIATLLGVVEGHGPEVKVNIDASGADASFQLAGQTIFSTGGALDSNIGTFLTGSFTYIMILSIVMALVYMTLGSVIRLGYARFNLNLVDRKEAVLENLFAYFRHWKTAIVTRLLTSLYTFLWTLLFMIPGIIASYSYAMTGYILAEHPELSAGEAIDRSKELMTGNRWRLFCLQFSFIGWGILCVFTCGIGNLWLMPYKQAATAAFYREISGTWKNVTCSEIEQG